MRSSDHPVTDPATHPAADLVTEIITEQVTRHGEWPSGERCDRQLDVGMATAEYAIATLAACGFAGLLVAILRSDEVRGMLLTIVQRALTLG